jgi:hypothetical protein
MWANDIKRKSGVVKRIRERTRWKDLAINMSLFSYLYQVPLFKPDGK